MSKRQSGTNSKETLLMGTVLDDPRWEKLATGEATPEEVADLHAWSRQSRLARKAWELFRPSTETETGALAGMLLRELEAAKVGAQKGGRRPQVPIPNSTKPYDGRMMSRHVPRERECSAKQVSSAPPVVDKRSFNPVGVPVRQTHPSPMQKPKLIHREPAKVLRPLADASKTMAGGSEFTGTTSAHLALSKEAAEASSLVAAAIATNPRLEIKKRSAWKIRRLYVTGMATFVVGLISLIFMVVWRQEARSLAADVAAANIDRANTHQAIQAMQPPRSASTSVKKEAVPSPIEGLVPVGVSSAGTTGGTTGTTAPLPTSSAASGVTAAASMLATSSSPATKRLPKTLPNPWRTIAKEKCTGAGVFQRCTKVP